jgi:hypothetical protein
MVASALNLAEVAISSFNAGWGAELAMLRPDVAVKLV